MQPQTRSEWAAAVRARPLAELLQCPPGTGDLLSGAAQRLDMEAAEIVFRQSEVCKGLYVVASGRFLRRTVRLETCVLLGVARAGELVELAAVLGDGRHTYTLTSQTDGSVVLLPMEALSRAFEAYPRMRMQLLEELARQVSRGYDASCQSRRFKAQGRGYGAGAAQA